MQNKAKWKVKQLEKIAGMSSDEEILPRPDGSLRIDARTSKKYHIWNSAPRSFSRICSPNSPIQNFETDDFVSRNKSHVINLYFVKLLRDGENPIRSYHVFYDSAFIFTFTQIRKPDASSHSDPAIRLQTSEINCKHMLLSSMCVYILEK